MTHARRETRNGSRQRPRHGRSAGWLFALLVMCFAVLPHLTLVASTGRMPMPVPAYHAGTAQAAAGDRMRMPVPCHEAGDAEAPASAAQPCCIIGCGLLAEAPAAPLLSAAPGWSRMSPRPVASLPSLSTEPGERPPRSALSA